MKMIQLKQHNQHKCINSYIPPFLSLTPLFLSNSSTDEILSYFFLYFQHCTKKQPLQKSREEPFKEAAMKQV